METDCPHRPGTDEWKTWQRKALAAEMERRREAAAGGARSDEGGYGATDEAKIAAGVQPGLPQFRRYGVPLNEIAEPWRSRVVEALRVPPTMNRLNQPLAPLQCPWCRNIYKREHYYRKHVPTCRHYEHIDAPMYTSGDHIPTVMSNPWRIVGHGATPAAQARWAAEDDARQRRARELYARFDGPALRALAVKLGSKRYPDVGQAIAVMELLAVHRWSPPPPQSHE